MWSDAHVLYHSWYLFHVYWCLYWMQYYCGMSEFKRGISINVNMWSLKSLQHNFFYIFSFLLKRCCQCYCVLQCQCYCVLQCQCYCVLQCQCYRVLKCQWYCVAMLMLLCVAMSVLLCVTMSMLPIFLMCFGWNCFIVIFLALFLILSLWYFYLTYFTFNSSLLLILFFSTYVIYMQIINWNYIWL